MKHNCFTEVSSQFDTITQNLDTLVSYWQRFTILIAEIRLLNSSCCRTGGWPCKCYVTDLKIIVQWARPAPYVGFSLHFQTAATPCACCTLMGITVLKVISLGKINSFFKHSCGNLTYWTGFIHKLSLGGNFEEYTDSNFCWTVKIATIDE
jgi:hypothetical protein